MKRHSGSQKQPMQSGIVDFESANIQAQRLIAAANELLAIANELNADGETSGASEAAEGFLFATSNNSVDNHALGKLASKHYHDRRNRDEIFGDETLFGEPAWDILLDLFIAAQAHKQVSVSSACIGAAVPTTTALRWLAVLEERGLIVRESDPKDARRVFVRLNVTGLEKMAHYFNSLDERAHR